ncbi:hypothetical protein ACJRO7_016940 [Eucalyptus globulus]|uniref:Core Histone H2A/H2B/H3 domain-containing protein n=1 Tax=Eucalyptus globulus TaxID=34317 RepID=A0ABD3KT34_EUCGL
MHSRWFFVFVLVLVVRVRVSKPRDSSNDRPLSLSLCNAGSASASRSPASPGPTSTPGTSTSPGRSPSSSHRRNPAASGQKKRRFRPGTVALREIRQFQKSWRLLIPRAPFIRTVKEISNALAPDITRWTVEALYAIQEAAEDFLVHLFEDAMLCAIHAKRVTLMRKDFELARRLGGKGQPW